jgi:hypothetical protein
MAVRVPAAAEAAGVAVVAEAQVVAGAVEEVKAGVAAAEGWAAAGAGAEAGAEAVAEAVAEVAAGGATAAPEITSGDKTARRIIKEPKVDTCIPYMCVHTGVRIMFATITLLQFPQALRETGQGHRDTLVLPHAAARVPAWTLWSDLHCTATRILGRLEEERCPLWEACDSRAPYSCNCTTPNCLG